MAKGGDFMAISQLNEGESWRRYAITGLSDEVAQRLGSGEDPRSIYDSLRGVSPVRWGAGPGASHREQLENELRLQAGWDIVQEMSGLGAANWGPC